MGQGVGIDKVMAKDREEQYEGKTVGDQGAGCPQRPYPTVLPRNVLVKGAAAKAARFLFLDLLGGV
jgi:hypothetical protein